MKDKKKIVISVLFVSSLLLNIFLLGIIVGHVSKRFFKKDINKIIDALPPKKKELFTKTIKNIRPGICNKLPKMRQGRKKIFTILTAPTFDAQVFQHETDKLNQIRQEMFKRRVQGIMELASQFTQEERKILVKYLEFEGQRRRERKHTRGGRGRR